MLRHNTFPCSCYPLRFLFFLPPRLQPVWVYMQKLFTSHMIKTFNNELISIVLQNLQSSMSTKFPEKQTALFLKHLFADTEEFHHK